MGGYAIGQKQQNNSQARQYGVFRWISPWFVLPLATLLHRSTSLGRSVEGGYVFLFLVFWSFGFRVGFHAPLLVTRMGGVSLSLHVLRLS